MKKTIYELAKEDAKHYKSLGKAICQDLYHGIFLASKHKENFWQRVYGYVIIKNNKEAKKISEAVGKEYMAIEFYEQNVIKDLKDDEFKIGLIWYFYEAGQLKEKLEGEALEKVKRYGKNMVKNE